MRFRLTRPVRGLLFDAGDVLYDATIWRRWLLQLLRRIGLYTNYLSFYHLLDHDFMADVYRGRRPFAEAFQAFLLSAGLSRAQIDEVEAACKARRNQWEATARPLPGVKSTLARLQAAGIAMGVVCNSEYPATVLRERFNRFGIGGFFPAIVSSIDLGHIKPEAVCYLSALGAMNLDAAEVAFVGHDTAELDGARRVGMQTIAFNFDRDAQADVFIARFEELVELVVNQPRYAAAG
jgi:HAD superfamily hydrolase (TIGR01509 family)